MALERNVTVKSVASNDLRNKLLIGTLPDGQLNSAGANIYSKTTGVDVSATDFFPDQEINQLILTEGAGNIALVFASGEAVLPFSVASGECKEVLRGMRIQQILSSGTTFSGHIFPIF